MNAKTIAQRANTEIAEAHGRLSDLLAQLGRAVDHLGTVQASLPGWAREPVAYCAGKRVTTPEEAAVVAASVSDTAARAEILAGTVVTALKQAEIRCRATQYKAGLPLARARVWSILEDVAALADEIQAATAHGPLGFAVKCDTAVTVATLRADKRLVTEFGDGLDEIFGGKSLGVMLSLLGDLGKGAKRIVPLALGLNAGGTLVTA